jgi:hypothetical protein
VAAAAPATTSDPEEFIRDKSDDKFDPQGRKKIQNKKPEVTTPDAPTIDADAQKKRQTSGARKPWGTVKDKDGRQVYIDADGGKWVWPANATSWQPANMVPGSDYVDKKLPTTTGYVPPEEEPPKIGFIKKLPGVKDYKGRQVWQRQDGLLAGFDPAEHRMYHIARKNPLMRDPNAPADNGGRPELIGKDHYDRDIYRYPNGRFGAWDADNRKMITIDAPALKEDINESSDMQRMRFLAGLTGN